MPAETHLRPTRRSLLLASGLGLATAAVLGGRRADAADPGQYPVSAAPLALVQPPDPFLGRMTPTAGAATAGMFAPQVAWPLIPIHAALLPNGHLVSYGTPVGQAVQGGMAYDDWSPADGTAATAHVQTPSMDAYNSFCNALQHLPDGRLLMVGGNSTMATMLFDAADGAETMGPGLNRQRWYASVLRRPDDRMLVLGGGDYYNTEAYRNPNDNTRVATAPEIGTGLGAWTLLGGADSTLAFGADRNRWWYPRAYNAPDGSVFGMSDDRMWSLSDTGSGSVRSLGTLPLAPGVSGSSAMYAAGRILVAGGGQAMNTQDVTATASAATVDISSSSPRTARTASMRLRRHWVNLTVMANGEVLANGGTVQGTAAGASNSTYPVEIWNPATGSWRTGASAVRIRTYHSASLLLQSGAVFTGGGGVPGPEDNLNAELYYPPHLFVRGSDGVTRWADRQRLTSIAGSLTYGGRLTLGLSDARAVASVSLIRLGNVTHGVNMDQRRIAVTFSQSGTALTVTLPSSRNVLPPGAYALQTVDRAGVPSPSQTITLRTTGAGTVTVYPPARTPGTGGDGGTAPGTVPLTVGAVVGLEGSNYLGHLLRRVADGTLALQAIGADAAQAVRSATSFVVRAGLAGTGISLESVDLPGRFLVATTGAVATVRAPAAGEASLATFVAVPGLTGQGTSLRLHADDTAYLRHRGFVARADTFDGSDLGRADATFRVKAALDPLPRGARVSLQPLDAPGSLVRHQNWTARVDVVGSGSSALDRADATFVVRPALDGAGGVSLEAVNYPGQYLMASGGLVLLRQPDGTATARTACSFGSALGRAATGLSLLGGSGVVSVAGTAVSTVVPATDDAARRAATLVVRAPVG